jgi:uncharacterized DUF497 family protein
MQMDVKHSLQGVIFEWDRRKAADNFRKHKITFELACEAFFDPLALFLDGEVIDEEIRETILGLTSDWNLLFVAYTTKQESVRIISARLATKPERRQYENQ